MRLIDMVRDKRVLACRVLMPNKRETLDLKRQWALEYWDEDVYGWLEEEPIDVVKELLREKGFKAEECLLWVQVDGVGSVSVCLGEDVTEMLKGFFAGG